MHLQVITLFPEFVEKSVDLGVTGRALSRGLLNLRCINPRDFADDDRGTVDDRPFGGGPGMVMKAEPLRRALACAVSSGRSHIVYLSPQGRHLRQGDINRLSGMKNVTLICGRYEGIDQRFIDGYVDEELSIGDFVLSGGELAAAVVIDAMIRQLPGALGKDASAEQDSFMAGLLDHPHYTRPERDDDGGIPAVLRSGDHGKVAQWRRQQALGITWLKRPDLLARSRLSDADRSLLQAFIAEYLQKTKKNDANPAENDIMAGL